MKVDVSVEQYSIGQLATQPGLVPVIVGNVNASLARLFLWVSTF